jgi:hypothetical protein
LSFRLVQSVTVSCDETMDTGDIWRCALEQTGLQVVASRNTGRSHVTTLKGLFQIMLGLLGVGGNVEAGGEHSIEIKSEVTVVPVAGPPSARQVADHFRSPRRLLVIENLQYLKAEVQKALCQQLKSLLDRDDFTAILVSTTHHASGVTDLVPDLLMRTTHIALGNWMPTDLERIAEQGFRHLELRVSPGTLSLIAAESVGLPLVTQQVCSRIAHRLRETHGPRPNAVVIDETHAFEAFASVAQNDFSSYTESFDRLTMDVDQRDYEVWSWMLGAFTAEPVQFCLPIGELTRRMRQCASAPSAAEACTLDRVREVVRRSVPPLAKQRPPILEWREESDTLYIVEPTFLYYLRWRNPRHASSTLARMCEETYELLLSRDRPGDGLKGLS